MKFFLLQWPLAVIDSHEDKVGCFDLSVAFITLSEMLQKWKNYLPHILSLLDVGTECGLVEKSHCDQWWSRLETLHIIWDSSALRYILCCSLAIWWSVSHISLTMRYLIFHCPCGVCRVFDIPQFCFSLLFPCSSKFGYSIGALIPQQVRFFIRIYWGWGCFSPRRLAADYKWYATRTLSSGRKDPIKEQSAVPFEGILWWDGYLLNVLLLGDG